VLILAFDTTSHVGGAAIYRDRQCLASVTNHGPANYYSITLFQMVDRILREAGLALSDIDLFAVAIGPGSFTGIRVGVAAAQGWASALDRPVWGTSVLEAMVEEAQPEAELAIPILDARRGEFFLGLFRPISHVTDRHFEPDEQGLVLKPVELGQFLSQASTSRGTAGSACCVVREHDQAARALRDKLPPSFSWLSVSGPLLGAIARLALRAQKLGKQQSPVDLDAYYIRRSDAELLFPRQQAQRSNA
jgi:tRNA threonylcarbamoyladenosine biosynthesis protein TsaB